MSVIETKPEGDFFAPRRCMREPIAEIFFASRLLDQAADAHLKGHFKDAEASIRAADIPAIRAWTESLWGAKANNLGQNQYHRYRSVEGAPPYSLKEGRPKQRMPSASERKEIIDRYGRNCVFCGVPLIRWQVRAAFGRKYPDALPWGRTNLTQHAAFQCMWMQFDHVLPHSRGGDNNLNNVVVTCAPCNFARSSWSLEEVGLIDPRSLTIPKTSWDGLERILLYARSA